MQSDIQAINLSKEFTDGNKDFLAIDGVSYSFPTCGLFFVLGKSGSGKSTLLFLLSGLEKPTSGEVLKKEGLRESFVFQDENFIFSLSLLDNLRLINPDEKRIDAVLSSVHLAEKKETSISLLSKGERARLAIAKALLSDADVIFLDEPTGNLDHANSDTVLALIKNLSKTILIICVSHDEDSANQYADVILRLNDGKLISVEEKKPLHEIESEKSSAKGDSAIPLRIAVEYAAKKVGPKRIKFWLSLLNLSLTGGMLFSALSLTWVDRKGIVKQAVDGADIDYYGIVEEHGGTDAEPIKTLRSGGSELLDETLSYGVHPQRTLSYGKAYFCSYDDVPDSLSVFLPDEGEAVVSDYVVSQSLFSVGDTLNYYGVSLSFKGTYDSNYHRYDGADENSPVADNCLRCYVNSDTFEKMVLAAPLHLDGVLSEIPLGSVRGGLGFVSFSSEKLLYGKEPTKENDLAIAESAVPYLFAGAVNNEQSLIGKEYSIRDDYVGNIDYHRLFSSFVISGIYDDSSSKTNLLCSAALWNTLETQREAMAGGSFSVSKEEVPLLAEPIHQKKMTFTSRSQNLILQASFVLQWADSLAIPFSIAGFVFLALGLSFLFSYIGDNLRSSEKDIALFELSGKSKNSINILFALTNSIVVLLALILCFGIGYLTLWGLGVYNQHAYGLQFTPMVINYWAYAVIFLGLTSLPILLSLWSSHKIKSYDIANIFKRSLV
jgi:ABC-type multidrug transport system ATPase subunit